nr:hypothetical protein [Ardenticatenia bacterium]
NGLVYRHHGSRGRDQGGRYGQRRGGWRRQAIAPVLEAHGRYQNVLANPEEKSGMVA